jgi:signal transduction histidine kinase
VRFCPAPNADASVERGGFSLRLYVVKKYTGLLGGSIEVESSLGVGSTFILQIPVPMSQLSMAQGAAAAEAARR